MNIPSRLKAILYQDEDLAANIITIVKPFVDILTKNDLYFFDEYTDHGIKHIENTLQSVENLTAEETFSVLTPKEVGVMIIAVVLHDIGMHTNTDMFKNMLEGKYDHVPGLFSKEKTWKMLWEEYLYDSKYWDAEKKVNIFGDNEGGHIIEVPNLDNMQLLNGYDRKFIGEFIRIHHCRIAYEVAQLGYIGRKITPFNDNNVIPTKMMTIAGIVARSHGMDVRDTFDTLKKKFGNPTNPLGYHAVYLMVLLRLADYLHIDKSRTNETILKIGTIGSPYSRQEHRTHLAIDGLEIKNIDKEKIEIEAYPEDAKTHTKIEWLVEDIQKEFDRSWAILAEVYPYNDYKLRYRRITTNIKDEDFKNDRTYVPKQFCYRFNNELAKLLIAPLYGDNPSYGVRELVQNAVDACRECMNDVKAGEEEPHVTVEVDTQEKLFTITDTGKGMTLKEIEQYFLTIGSSYNGDVNWQKKRDAEHIYRTGRFGIGVLAAYLLGPEIVVETRSRSGETGYRFKASLEDKFIQIDKAPDAAFGTKIEIKCDDDCISDLSFQVSYKELEKDRRWYDWYINKKPKVEYYHDGDQIQTTSPLGYKLLIHNNKKFSGSILWESQPMLKDIRTHECLLYCNGFFITDKPNKIYFSLKGVGDYYPLEIPSLQIEDSHNKLPLNLQRSNIEKGITYPFEQELATAMFTDLICQLMAINIKAPKKIINIRDYYFNANGFAFKNQYSQDQLRGKQIINIGVLDNERFYYELWKDIFKLFPDALFHFCIKSFENIADVSTYNIEDDIRNGISLFFSRKPNVAIINPQNFRNHIKNILLEFINNNQDYKYLDSFIFSSDSKYRSVLEELIRRVEKIMYYYELPLTYIIIEDTETGTNDPMFHAVFDKFFNGDPIIPYDIAERENKFPLIHQEYKKEIEEYKALYRALPDANDE